MSYTLTVSGHREDAETEEQAELEAAVTEKCRAFVAELEGVTAASLFLGIGGTVDLLEAV